MAKNQAQRLQQEHQILPEVGDESTEIVAEFFHKTLPLLPLPCLAGSDNFHPHNLCSKIPFIQKTSAEYMHADSVGLLQDSGCTFKIIPHLSWSGRGMPQTLSLPPQAPVWVLKYSTLRFLGMKFDWFQPISTRFLRWCCSLSSDRLSTRVCLS